MKATTRVIFLSVFLILLFAPGLVNADRGLTVTILPGDAYSLDVKLTSIGKSYVLKGECENPEALQCFVQWMKDESLIRKDVYVPDNGSLYWAVYAPANANIGVVEIRNTAKEKLVIKDFSFSQEVVSASGEIKEVSEIEDICEPLDPKEYWSLFPPLPLPHQGRIIQMHPIFNRFFEFGFINTAEFGMDIARKTDEMMNVPVKNDMLGMPVEKDLPDIIAGDIRYNPYMKGHSTYSTKYYPRRMQDYIESYFLPAYILSEDPKYLARMEELLAFLQYSQWKEDGSNDFVKEVFPEYNALHPEWYGGFDYLFDWEWLDAYRYLWRLHEPDHHVSSIIAGTFITGYELTGKIDSHAMSYSIDNGNSYYSFAVMNTKSSAMGGTYRRYWQTQIVDPEKDKMIVIFLEGLLPNDNPSEGMSNWTLWYGITTDGGKTFETLEQIIKTGDIYGPEYPVDGVYTGKNSMAVGEITCLPIKLQRQRGSGNGRILVPVQISVLNEHGELYNPGGSFGYLYCAVLIGTWNQEGKLDWDISQPIVADPNKTPIGVMEPTIAEMPSGEILMVMRGGNGGSKDEKYALDCFKWYSYSEDGGYTWTPPKPWMCDDNTVFYSPSSCSQLLEHSNGKYYWIGIVSNTNPQNDYPGWPLVIGEVNPKDFRLIRDSVTVIDIKRPEQSSSVTYTNFFAREDRVSHDILVYCTPMFEQGRSDNPADLTAHTYVYTVNIK